MEKIVGRRNGRVNALRVLYLLDVYKNLTVEEAIKTVFNEIEFETDTREFFEKIVKGTLNNIQIIDSYIEKHTINWKLDRMATVDKNIMRIATYEMMNMPETPINVIIDEAVEIAKQYSNSDSSKFINGILDKVKIIRKELNNK